MKITAIITPIIVFINIICLIIIFNVPIEDVTIVRLILIANIIGIIVLFIWRKKEEIE